MNITKRIMTTVHYGTITFEARGNKVVYSFSTGEDGFTQYEYGDESKFTEKELNEIQNKLNNI